ncbi:MAG: type II secretion system F family protein [Candidatus Pacearchaeota archaeon]
MEIKKGQWVGIIIGLVIIASSVFFMGTDLFFFLAGVGVVVAVSPFILSVMKEARVDLEKEEMFLEFARSLVESVKTGTPISRSIINIKNKSFGVLSPHIKKLSNQISLGIPLSMALQVFSKDIGNKTISRSLTLIGQAEKAGGDIGRILEDVAGAVNTSDKIKKERKAAISTLVVQGYIIFFVFLVIVLVMQFKIIPIIEGISTIGSAGGSIGGVGGFGGGGGGSLNPDELSSSFLYLLLIQGLFSGLTIGKLSDESLKAGVKHSFAMMISAFLISTGANLIFGGA